ncbi:uncharacterized protein EAF01_010823 [Botrytis porri]|uniref:uncharacterized protein n=1 Tax=Botrytis porri TaxID=87229 RepID=UPI0019023E7A|nr:uncharacterized protein EAF01_010823 [Botrytis porri]KAF7889330.1 hypothetical protein EAF01_010823 [Botrytis porri]
MRAALHSGADPNALDKVRRPEQSMERPLHYATDVTHFDFMPRYENLPILELLEFGADPRMKGMAETRESPLRERYEVFNAALVVIEEKVNELEVNEAKKAASWTDSCQVS